MKKNTYLTLWREYKEYSGRPSTEKQHCMSRTYTFNFLRICDVFGLQYAFCSLSSFAFGFDQNQLLCN